MPERLRERSGLDSEGGADADQAAVQGDRRLARQRDRLAYRGRDQSGPLRIHSISVGFKIGARSLGQMLSLRHLPSIPLVERRCRHAVFATYFTFHGQHSPPPPPHRHSLSLSVGRSVGRSVDLTPSCPSLTANHSLASQEKA